MRSQDLAPAPPAGAALAATGPDEWLRYAPAWHAGMVGLAALTGVLVAVDDGIGSAGRYAALALTTALTIWYAVLGSRGLRREPEWCAQAYVVIAAPLTVAAFAAAPVGSMLLFALYPHIWVMLPPRRAVAATVAVVGAVAAVAVARQPLNGSTLGAALLLGAVSLVVALVLGLWIARIIRQSGRRAELLAELAATRVELAAVSRTAGVLAERERLAHEIHDTLAQGFTSVLLLLEAAGTALGSDPAAARRHLDRARDTARENLAEARALVAALTPPDLTRTSLPEALRRIVERADADAGLRAAFVVNGTPRGLPVDHEVALVRAAQEALTNVRKHAGASRVDVSLAYGSAGVSLVVHDDGCGFDPAAPPRDGGYGLAGMRARADRVGGTISVVASPGTGATVRIDLPAAGG
ncbi:MAG TPA: sensor histidine kinase [Pilimelia sp.]|nr:sensor histidine kinase [Pilimelia sp.]